MHRLCKTINMVMRFPATGGPRLGFTALKERWNPRNPNVRNPDRRSSGIRDANSGFVMLFYIHKMASSYLCYIMNVLG